MSKRLAGMIMLGSLSAWFTSAMLPGVLMILLQILNFGNVGLTFTALLGFAVSLATGALAPAIFVFAL
jgi:hypothetical protein